MELSVSVRELVEYTLRSGSIDFEYQSRAARAADGVIYHQKLQKRREREAALLGFSYEKEVYFKHAFTADELEITVKGRADGVLKKDSGVFIEEIKTTEKPLALITETETHIAQAKCYAYFYMLENEIENINVLLTYYNTKTHETKEYEYRLTKTELAEFFHSVLRMYAKWASFIIACKEARNLSIQSLPFPYEDYRKLQREMCVSVYRAIERKRIVFVNAPTGIGKTISALFPAVKALANVKLDKIFYLTAKTITGKAALDAAALMEKNGLKSKTLVITARDKACFLEKPSCSPDACASAAGHFDRVNNALFDILENETIISKEVLLTYAKKHNVCPYEFCLDIALFADIVICDYNYAFDPRVYLRRFFAETNEKYVFLIDEAHNLVDRAREMYSAEINRAGMSALSRRLRKSAGELKRIIAGIISELSELTKNISDDDYGNVLDRAPKKIIEDMRAYCYAADKWLIENAGAKPPFYEDLRELFFEFNHFIAISEMLDEKFAVCVEAQGGGRLKLFCADPSGRIEIMLKNSCSAVFFSGTLTPLDYFKRLLGAAEGDYAVSYPSPFPRENLCILAMAGVSARYKDRERYYEDIADYIYTAANVKAGNYFAFFPSYAYLESVFEVFSEKYPLVKTLCQTKNMVEAEKDGFLGNFDENGGELFIAFGVLGGMFSEGIDLPGERLIGAFIVSVGLPVPSLERRIISGCFENEGMGFEYSYMFPGMNKVLQAGGRVVRTETDKGLIVLIDERFSQNNYKNLFPEGWGGFRTIRGKEALKSAVTEFWSGFCQ